MGALAFLDLLTEKGCYTQEEADTVAFSAVADMFLKAKPSMSQAHRVRTVMQNKFFMDRAFGNSIRTTKFTSILKKFSLLQKKCLHRLYEFK
jgi:hypothetical protein